MHQVLKVLFKLDEYFLHSIEIFKSGQKEKKKGKEKTEFFTLNGVKLLLKLTFHNGHKRGPKVNSTGLQSLCIVLQLALVQVITTAISNIQDLFY